MFLGATGDVPFPQDTGLNFQAPFSLRLRLTYPLVGISEKCPGPHMLLSWREILLREKKSNGTRDFSGSSFLRNLTLFFGQMPKRYRSIKSLSVDCCHDPVVVRNSDLHNVPRRAMKDSDPFVALKAPYFKTTSLGRDYSEATILGDRHWH